MADIIGTEGDDTLVGTGGSDLIEGLGGNDNLSDTLGGHDVIRGGDGNDVIFATRNTSSPTGTVRVEGGEGDDDITVSAFSPGDVVAEGGAGNDTIRGSGYLYGGAGNDLLVALGPGYFDAGDGDDTVIVVARGSFGFDLGSGNDRITASFAPGPYPYVTTGTGQDVISGRIQIQDFTVGDSGDRIEWTEYLARVPGWDQSTNPFATGHMALQTEGSLLVLKTTNAVAGRFNDWLVYFSNGLTPADFTAYNLGGYAPDGSAPASVTLTGTAGADSLAGGIGSDTINGGGGNDTLTGGFGHDQIDGGEGDDWIDGGLGSDTILGGDGHDVIVDHYGYRGTIEGGAGNDTITVDVGIVPGLPAPQPAAPPLFMRTIHGGDGDDVISFVGYAQYSQSTITGGGGHDTITIAGLTNVDAGDGNDIVDARWVGSTVNAGAGEDRVRMAGSSSSTAASTVTLGAGRDLLQLSAQIQNGFTALVVTDFESGTGGDVFDLPDLLINNPFGWNYSGNPFAAGHLRLVQAGADVALQGRLPSGSYVTVVTFQNELLGTFTADNFGGYDPNGAPPPGQVIVGTEGDDTLGGGIGDDLIQGLGGNDRLTGGFGDDRLEGGEGNDTLDGQWGADTLEGGAGDDLLSDTIHGNDTLRGGDGNDTITVSRPIDNSVSTLVLEGGAGDDVIFARGARNTNGSALLTNAAITGGAGNDRITTAGLNGTVGSGDGDDVLDITSMWSGAISSGAGNDTVTYRGVFIMGGGTTDLGSGDDVLRLEFSAQTSTSEHRLTLGAGRDTVLVDTASRADILDFQPGEEGDRLDLSVFGTHPFHVGGPRLSISQQGADVVISETQLGRFFILRNVQAADLSTYNLGVPTGFFDPQDRTFVGTAGEDHYISADGDDSLSGGDGADTLYGAGGNDVLAGGDGDDRLHGGSGNDIMYGGGADYMAGGTGDDSYVIDHPGDHVVEGPGQGRDVVYANIDYFLPADVHVEILSSGSLAGTHALNLAGNALDQLIYGNAGANALNGGGGLDTLIGLGGDDVYYVSDGRERIVEASGEGRDVVYASVGYALNSGAHVEVLSTASLAGTEAIDLAGNELRQEIYGNAGANRLNGGGGADVLVGFGGDDQYYIAGGGEIIVESSGQGRDVVYTGVTYALNAGAEVEVLSSISIASTATLYLVGNEHGQEVLGNNGNNYLDGGGGADTLIGYGAADTFGFTTALGGGNVDRIVDFEAGLDRIGLDDAIFAGIGAGSFNPNAFRLGATAQDADDRILYDQATGQLFYDADGNGAGAAVLFATLNAGTVLTANDFTVL